MFLGERKPHSFHMKCNIFPTEDRYSGLGSDLRVGVGQAPTQQERMEKARPRQKERKGRTRPDSKGREEQAWHSPKGKGRARPDPRAKEG